MGRKEDSPLTSEVTLTCASVKSFTHNSFQYHQGMASCDTSKQILLAVQAPSLLALLDVYHCTISSSSGLKLPLALPEDTRGLGVILGDSCFSKSIFKEGLVFTFF